jgi:hypothetical protein
LSNSMRINFVPQCKLIFPCFMGHAAVGSESLILFHFSYSFIITRILWNEFKQFLYLNDCNCIFPKSSFRLIWCYVRCAVDEALLNQNVSIFLHNESLLLKLYLLAFFMRINSRLMSSQCYVCVFVGLCVCFQLLN